MNTLFEQMGGRNAVNLAVNRFCKPTYIKCERIKHFFENAAESLIARLMLVKNWLSLYYTSEYYRLSGF